MKAIHLLAPATFAISAALSPAAGLEPARSTTGTMDSRRPKVLPQWTESASGGRNEAALECRAPKAALIRTEFVRSARERRILGCDDCGNLFSYYVTIFTLRDVFSDGTSKHRFQTMGD